MNGQIVTRTEAQALALADFIRENADGEEMVFTQQGENIYAAASLTSVTIDTDGEAIE